MWTVVALAAGTIVTLLAGIVPALKAMRVPPIAAVREGAILHGSRGRGQLVGLVLGILGTLLLVKVAVSNGGVASIFAWPRPSAGVHVAGTINLSGFRRHSPGTTSGGAG